MEKELKEHIKEINKHLKTRDDAINSRLKKKFRIKEDEKGGGTPVKKKQGKNSKNADNTQSTGKNSNNSKNAGKKSNNSGKKSNNSKNTGKKSKNTKNSEEKSKNVQKSSNTSKAKNKSIGVTKETMVIILIEHNINANKS
jgi:hypothetical protein